ncbi:MAG: tyrosinase family protein [Actinomycetes bacterium]
MFVRTRLDVWRLSVGSELAAATEPWHPVLDTYARGVQLMMERDNPPTPDSWLWAANTHGVPFGEPTHVRWDQCAHASVFFLPWHRAYLAWFESTLITLTGDAEWALPYWDYARDPDQTLTMPPEFTVPERTVDGQLIPNTLFRPGRTTILPIDDVGYGGLVEPRFVRAFPRAGFGGLDADGRFGTLESLPHNNVHVDIGAEMQSTTVAGRDPIFWLHHSNIDRLWEAWLALPGSTRLEDQTDLPAQLVSTWGSAVIQFGDTAAHPANATYQLGQLADTTAQPLCYSYEDARVPEPIAERIAEIRATLPGGPMGLDETDRERWTPVGAVADAHSQDPTTIGLEPLPLGLDGAGPTGLVIDLAGVRAVHPHAQYTVWVRTAPDAPAHAAGRFATFGLEGTPDDEERSYAIDAGEVLPILQAEGWQGGELTVEVLPTAGRPDAQAPDRGIDIAQIVVYVRT